MTERFCAGIDMFNDRALALVADTKTGKIPAIEEGESAQQAFERALKLSAIEEDQLLAIGFSERSPRLKPWAFSNVPTVFAKSRAHASFVGAGVAPPSTMVLAFEANHCTLLMNSRVEAQIEGATMIADSILPGFFGYTFAPIRFDRDQFANNVREKCESLRSAGVQVRRFVATHALSPPLMQTLANVLSARVKLAANEHPAALGAAILAAIAAGPHHAGHASQSQLIHAMARVRRDLVYRPDIRARG